MSLAQLIEQLKDDNRIVRQAAYDELADIQWYILYSLTLDGPWRVQQNHLCMADLVEGKRKGFSKRPLVLSRRTDLARDES